MFDIFPQKNDWNDQLDTKIVADRFCFNQLINYYSSYCKEKQMFDISAWKMTKTNESVLQFVAD